MTSWRRTAGANAHEVSALERLLLTLDQQGERSVEHEVDLLLLRMAVDAATLAGFEHHLVEPEGRDPELAAEGDEALGCVEVEPCAGDARFHGDDANRARPERGSCPSY